MPVELHNPVMLHEVIAAMRPADDEIYVDATFGAGGYSRALLEAAGCRVIAIDRDPTVKVIAERLQQEFAGRFCFIAGSFSEMTDLLATIGVGQVDGIVLDIGVSSMQIDDAQRGFSFQKNGPLDMRQSQQGQSAADVVNAMEENELADILYTFGEEKKSRAIARAICKARAEEPIVTTIQLAEVIRSVFPKKPQAIDPATRSFQALRIYINRELDELQDALQQSEALLRTGGTLVVVSFHSLEDRIVKQFMRTRSSVTSGGSRHRPVAVACPSTFTLPMRKAQLASEQEITHNPRARSAKLRVAIRSAA